MAYIYMKLPELLPDNSSHLGTELSLQVSVPARDLDGMLRRPLLAANLRLCLGRHDDVEPEQLESAAAGEATLACLRLVFHVCQAL
jgi:hypothetical protein